MVIDAMVGFDDVGGEMRMADWVEHDHGGRAQSWASTGSARRQRARADRHDLQIADGGEKKMGSAWLGTRRKEDGDASNDRRW